MGHHHLANLQLGHHQSLADVLRTTTLEEFFDAVQKIQADDEQLIQDTSDNSEGKKNLGLLQQDLLNSVL